MTGETLDKYLAPSSFSDSDDLFLKSRARQITIGSSGKKDTAIKIFNFTRDHIIYGSSDLYRKASQVLIGGVGNCKIKANAQMCLLRAVGIPARLHAARVKTEALKYLYPSWILEKLPKIFIHVWCECYLSNTWIACDATFDKPLFKAMLRKDPLLGHTTPTIDWDGEVGLTLLNLWQVEDVALFASYDEIIQRGEMPPKWILKLFGWLTSVPVNWHLARMRKGNFT